MTVSHPSSPRPTSLRIADRFDDGADVAWREFGDGPLHSLPTMLRRDDGTVVSAGGRVLCAVGTGPDLNAARDRVYRTLAGIQLPGSHFRTDIGLVAAQGEIRL